MKIGYDIRCFLKEETGVGIYFKSLLTALASLDDENEYHLFSASLRDRFDIGNLPPFKNRVFRDRRIPVSLLNRLWYHHGWPTLDRMVGARLDLIHSATPLIVPGGGRQIVTVHDLSFLDTPDLVMEEALTFFRPRIAASLSRADGIIAVSAFTRSRIEAHFGEEVASRTRVIHHGSDMDAVREKAPGHPLPESYILFVGTIEPRKNPLLLAEAMRVVSEARPELKLLIAGKAGSAAPGLRALLARLGIGDRVEFLDYTDRGMLKYLYRRARLLVFPSLYEGFGLPILEAAGCGLPVVASDLTVFEEIYADFPLYFRSGEAADMAGKIVELLDNRDLYDRKKAQAGAIEGKYSWARTARETLEFYNCVIEGG